MNVEEILEDLKYHIGGFPEEALKEAVARKEEITPALLKIIEETIQRSEALADEYYMAPVYAMYLLAQFRERRAYPLLVQLFSMPDDVIGESLGQIMTQDLSRILASVANGDAGLIKSLVENEQASDRARGAALGALLTQVARGEATREELVPYYRSLFRGGLRRDGSDVWNELVSCSTDLHPYGLMEDIRRAYDDGLVAPGYIGLEDVAGALRRKKETALRELQERTEYRLVENVIEDIGWWAFFGEPIKCRWPDPSETRGRDAGGSSWNPYVEQPIRTVKIGRNEPCPCGSGKKYKKCCGRER